MRKLPLLVLPFSAAALAQVVSTQVPLHKFQDVASEVGLTVSHTSSPDKQYIVESMSGDVGLIDCDNDGKPVILTVNGSTIDRFRQSGDPMITL